MAAALSLDVPSKVDLRVGSEFALAQISIGASAPQGPKIAEAGDLQLGGDIDFAWNRCSGDRLSSDWLAHAWSRDRAAILHEIDGEFAFAAWDAATRRLDLVRDHCGSRPILYAHEPGQWFAFAQFYCSLRVSGLPIGGADLTEVAEWAARSFRQSTKTHVKGICRVLQGERLEISQGNISRHRYWQPKATPDRTRSYQTVVSGLQSRLREAVRRRLPQNGPAFSHLSGGLDSTGIAAIAAQELASVQQNVTGYCFVPVPMAELDHVVDERPAVQATVRAHPNIDLIEISGPSFDILPEAAMDADLPWLTNPELEYEQALRHAAANGATHLLSGFGGDQVASSLGRGALLELLLSGRWIALAQLTRKPIDGRSGWRSLGVELAMSFIPEWILKTRRRLRSARAASLTDFLVPSFRKAMLSQRFPRNTHRNRAAQLCNGHLNTIVEELTWRAARHGLGYCFPLLDRELVEYSLSIPAEMLLHEGQRRRVFRDALKDIVPDEARLRNEKLVADPTSGIRLAGSRHTLLAELDKLRSGPAAEIFDLDRIEKDIRNLPDPDEALEEIRKATARGVQYSSGNAFQFIWPYMLALFVDQRDRLVTQSLTHR